MFILVCGVGSPDLAGTGICKTRITMTKKTEFHDLAKRTEFELMWCRVDQFLSRHKSPTYAVIIKTNCVECFTLRNQRVIDINSPHVYHSLQWGDLEYNWVVRAYTPRSLQ